MASQKIKEGVINHSRAKSLNVVAHASKGVQRDYLPTTEGHVDHIIAPNRLLKVTTD